MNRRSANPYESFASKNTGKLKTPRSSTDIFTQKKKKRPVLHVAGVVLIAAIVLLGAYNALCMQSVRVDVVTVPVPKLPDAFEGYTILHISDLYGQRLGEGQEKIRRALEGRSFNAVCMTGDMIAPSGDAQPFYELIEALDTTKPVYFVTGEQDPVSIMTDASEGDGVLATYITGAQQRGTTFLDAPVCIQSGGKRLWFTPESALTLDVDATEATVQNRLAEEKQKGESGADAYIRRHALEYQLERTQRIRAAKEQMQEEDVCVVLTHVPLSREFVSGMSSTGVVNKLIARIDLVLAGHLNGGQVCLPFVGPVYVPGRGLFPGTQGVSGLETVGNIPQYISPGLGVNPAWLIPFRLFNRPAVTLIKLTAKM